MIHKNVVLFTKKIFTRKLEEKDLEKKRYYMVKFSVVEELKLQKRQASEKYLEKLVKSFQDFDENNTIPVATLKKVKLSEKKWREHLEERKAFEEYEEETYDFALYTLQNRAISKLKLHVTLACRKSKKKKIKTIQRCSRAAAKHVKWVPPSFQAKL